MANGRRPITGSNKEYNDLIDYVKSHDLSIKENYDYVASKIDIDNYIDWCAIEIYTGNSDLGNIKFWKPQTPDSKWRWILFDMDWGFFFADQKRSTGMNSTVISSAGSSIPEATAWGAGLATL